MFTVMKWPQSYLQHASFQTTIIIGQLVTPMTLRFYLHDIEKHDLPKFFSPKNNSEFSLLNFFFFCNSRIIYSSLNPIYTNTLKMKDATWHMKPLFFIFMDLIFLSSLEYPKKKKKYKQIKTTIQTTITI